MNNQSKIGILAFVPDEWGELYQSRHHILKGLSEHYKVLWISPPYYFENWRSTGVKCWFPLSRVHKVSKSLWCYRPWLPTDYKRGKLNKTVFALIFKIYHKIWMQFYIFRIKKILKKFRISKIILYNWRPEFNWSLNSFDELLSCYHIDDEYSFNGIKDEEINPDEILLLKKSDLVFIHSKSLMKKKGAINSNTFEIPNGVDFELYQNLLQVPYKEPTDISNIKKPRIGYMGHIKRHIDLSLLYEIAKLRPEWSIILIGPIRQDHLDIKENVSKLKSLPNVFLLGGKSWSILPEYINALDVCLMPYRKTSYTRYIYPMKMHEYFACGKPVVSTKLENLQEFSGALLFADSPLEWILSIQYALDNYSADKKTTLVNIARENSWAIRVQKIKEIIDMRLTGTRNTTQ
jgi:glycosyltransferase involved in cell wall biosynthesis